MGNRIHTRIFYLVLLVILLLTGSAWFIFSSTSQWYVNVTAERDAERVIKIVEGLAGEIYRDAPAPEDRTPEEDRAYSKELLKQVKQSVKSGETGGRHLVFNSKLKKIYPDDQDETAGFDRFTSACVELIESGQLDRTAGTNIEAGGENWSIRLFQAEAENNVRAKYFIAAARIPDVALLWNYTGKLLAFIAIAAVFVAAGMIWMVAGSIARPLEQLCGQAKAIGDGKSAQIEDVYSVRELETLKQACNRMELKIRESEKQKERFFQNVSHDLRTPLSSIIGYAQGIQCDVMKEHKKAAGVILSESMRMMNLVESILTLTKMDNNELKMHMTEIDLEEFLEERMDALLGIAGGSKLRMEPGERDVYVWADPELLGRIVQNVLSNCIRYGKSEVLVRCETDGEQAVILVEDDGMGFSMEDIPHVFERFYQGKGGEFGIGLSVVRTGMEYLGGRVEIGNRKPPENGAYYRLVLAAGTPDPAHCIGK